MFVDVEAEDSNPARFGVILARTEADTLSRDKVLVVAPEDQADRWLEIAASFYPTLPATVLGDADGLGPRFKRIWRPVAELCRQYATD